jgi:hypothetical protein
LVESGDTGGRGCHLKVSLFLPFQTFDIEMKKGGRKTRGRAIFVLCFCRFDFLLNYAKVKGSLIFYSILDAGGKN